MVFEARSARIQGRGPMRLRWFALAAALGALAPAIAAADPIPPLVPRLGFASDTVVVEGITLGGKVVWFGAAQSLAGDDVAEIRYYGRVAEDTDQDGIERLALPIGIPTHGVFVAIDFASGLAASAASPGYPLRQVPWRGRGVGDSGRGEDWIEDARALANVLVVRPGVGAWVATVSDGRPEDDDGRLDGRLRLLLSSLQPLGDFVAPVPARVLPIDIVAMVDPRQLELTLVTPPRGNASTAGGQSP